MRISLLLRPASRWRVCYQRGLPRLVFRYPPPVKQKIANLIFPFHMPEVSLLCLDVQLCWNFLSTGFLWLAVFPLERCFCIVSQEIFDFSIPLFPLPIKMSKIWNITSLCKSWLLVIVSLFLQYEFHLPSCAWCWLPSRPGVQKHGILVIQAHGYSWFTTSTFTDKHANVI